MTCRIVWTLFPFEMHHHCEMRQFLHLKYGKGSRVRIRGELFPIIPLKHQSHPMFCPSFCIPTWYLVSLHIIEKTRAVHESEDGGGKLQKSALCFRACQAFFLRTSQRHLIRLTSFSVATGELQPLHDGMAWSWGLQV